MNTELIVSGLALTNPHVGQGVYTLRLIRGLARRSGSNFRVITSPDICLPPDVAKYQLQFSFPARLLQHQLLRQLAFSELAMRFAARHFPDAVFHSPGPIAGTIRPKKCVVTLHDCIYRHFRRYTGRFFLRRLFLRATERFAANSSLILTGSEFSKNDLVEQAAIPRERIEILYPWVGPEYSRPISEAETSQLKQKLNLPNRFWLYIGGYDYRKNIEFLLQAYAKAGKQRTAPPLVLAGQIPQPTRTTCDVAGTLKRLGLHSDQIRLPGAISEEDLPVLYRATSLFIFPSLMEGFGLPPAEATAVGTPVLASNRSSLPEVVTRKDCLFDPQNEENLVAKLLEAMKDESRFVARLSESFTESYAIDHYLRIISEVGQIHRLLHPASTSA
jgi:glycosyltransferase involved in cell wall biosynthesis